MDYILKVTLISSIIYLFYKLFLENDTFFQSIRAYFVVGIVLSFLLPLLIIPIYIEVESVVTPEMIKVSNFAELDHLTQETIPLLKKQFIDWLLVLQYVYFIGIAIFTLKFIIELISLIRLIKISDKNKIGNYYFIEINNNISPFSFFKYIVYNKAYFSKNELINVIEHEKVHVNQLHSLDNLIAQLFVIVQWFNPIVWLYKKELQQNLEYIADSIAQEKAKTHKKYQYLLLKTGIKNNSFALSNNFFNSQLKKRIIMLQKSQTKKFNQVKYALLIPLISLFLYSFNIKEVYIGKTKSSINFSNKTIVIDAGHGGQDAGAISNGILEKDIALSISKKVKELYNGTATIILIRDSDKFLSLTDKIDKVNKIKPDLLISLHVNSSLNKKDNGLITYISEDNLEAESSEKIANNLMAKFSKTNLKCEFLSLANFKMLAKVNCSAVLVEAGYISNKKDRDYISSIKGQNDLAQSIVDLINGKQSNNYQPKFILPIRKENVISISSKFGMRTHPITKKQKFHKGIDFKAKNNINVHAVESGVVLISGFDNSKGNFIIIKHKGNYATRYYHLGKIKVKAGSAVSAGEIIGVVGSTGKSLSPHLHFEILKNNKNVNPKDYLQLPVIKKNNHRNSSSKNNISKGFSKFSSNKKIKETPYSGANVMIVKSTTNKDIENYISLFKKENNIDLKIYNLKRNTKKEIIEIAIEAKSKTAFSTYSYSQKEPIHQIFIGFDKNRDEIVITNVTFGNKQNKEPNKSGWIYLEHKGTYFYKIQKNEVEFFNRYGVTTMLDLSEKLLIKLNKQDKRRYVLKEQHRNQAGFINYKGEEFFYTLKKEKPIFRDKYGAVVNNKLTQELLIKYELRKEKRIKLKNRVDEIRRNKRKHVKVIKETDVKK